MENRNQQNQNLENKAGREFVSWFSTVWGAGLGLIAGPLLVYLFGLGTEARGLNVMFVAAVLGAVIGALGSWYWARNRTRGALG